MATNIQKLTADLKDANVAASYAALQPENDGGTSNFDCPCIQIRLTPKVKAAFEAVRMRAYPGYGGSKGYIMVGGFQGDSFQGFRRTAAAKAFSEYMIKMGWASKVHYAMD